jgi:hypothetical protein
MKKIVLGIVIAVLLVVVGNGLIDVDERQARQLATCQADAMHNYPGVYTGREDVIEYVRLCMRGAGYAFTYVGSAETQGGCFASEHVTDARCYIPAGFSEYWLYRIRHPTDRRR